LWIENQREPFFVLKADIRQGGTLEETPKAATDQSQSRARPEPVNRIAIAPGSDLFSVVKRFVFISAVGDRGFPKRKGEDESRVVTSIHAVCRGHVLQEHCRLRGAQVSLTLVPAPVLRGGPVAGILPLSRACLLGALGGPVWEGETSPRCPAAAAA